MVRVTSKFRVTILGEVGKDLGIRIGDDIVFLRAVSGAYQVMKASEFVGRFCEESRDIGQTVEDFRVGLGRAMGKDVDPLLMSECLNGQVPSDGWGRPHPGIPLLGATGYLTPASRSSLSM